MHTEIQEQCQYCDFTANDNVQSHVIEEHEELYILHTMASQINSLCDSFASFETFKVELTNVLKTETWQSDNKQ